MANAVELLGAVHPTLVPKDGDDGPYIQPGAFDRAVDALPAPEALALLVRLAAVLELRHDGPQREAGEELLDFAELDWAQLQGQARRELAGGETADAKLARLEGSPLVDVENLPVAAIDALEAAGVTSLELLRARFDDWCRNTKRAGTFRQMLAQYLTTAAVGLKLKVASQAASALDLPLSRVAPAAGGV